jgi:tetratricopeptide (TPR) repeat protein
MNAYEQALRHNSRSIAAMNAISSILRAQEQFPRAVEYLQNILKLDGNNGDVWGSLGKLSKYYPLFLVAHLLTPH